MSKNTAKNIVKLELEKKLKNEENLISKNYGISWRY